MDLLFRPVFTRVKTPVIGSAQDRQASFSTDDNNDSEEGIMMTNRIRPTSRVSSYMGFRPSTPPIPAPETFPNLRNPENVYHKPSGDQLAEMLKVVMMNQSTMDSVPVQYNSTILHVLEAYQDSRMQLMAKEETIEILKQSHTKDIKDFEELAAAWQQKENEYKGEVKKLEVLLSKTEGGMESVAMARSRSVIHGAQKASEAIRRGIGTIKARNAARNSQDAGIDSPDFDTVQKSIRTRRSFQIRDDRDYSASASFEPPRRSPRKRKTIDSHPRAECSQFSRGSMQLYGSPEVQTAKASLQGSDYQPQTLTKSQLDALERQQAQEFGVNFESSTESGADSGSISHCSDFPVAHGRQTLGHGILEKPLPEIPISARERARQTTLDKFLNARQHTYSDLNSATTPVKHATPEYGLGFSFQPGDDEALLARRTERDRAQRKAVNEHLDHRTFVSSPRESISNTTSDTPDSSHRPKETTQPEVKPKSSKTGLSQTATAKPSHLPRFQDHDQLSRMDSSSSSIVTAVRDNSGRSSANDSQAGRPKLNRDAGTSGSGEAVTAATRALAASKKNSPRESRMGSTSVSRKGSASGSGSGAHAETQVRNDFEGYKSMIGSGATSIRSIRSTNSSVSGKEIGNDKKITGGVRMVEK